jgi:DNA-binding MarR family transcriptional regulator
MSLAVSGSPAPLPTGAAPAPSAEALVSGLGRLLDDLHEQLADDQLRTLARLRLEPADLLALGEAGSTSGGTQADLAALDRLQRHGLVERGGRGEVFRPTAAGRAMLDELLDARRASIRRFVDRLDRGQRLRLGGALHLLSDELGGAAVVGP